MNQNPREIAKKISSSDHKLFFIEGKELRCDYDEYATNEGIRDCTVNVCQTKDLIDLARAYLELLEKNKPGHYTLASEHFDRLATDLEYDQLQEKYDELKANYKEATKAEFKILQTYYDDLYIRADGDRITKLELDNADLICKLEDANAALNQIGMLGMSEHAYTSEFTERVRSIVKERLK